jgi:hypothetical protein
VSERDQSENDTRGPLLRVELLDGEIFYGPTHRPSAQQVFPGSWKIL